MILVSHTDTRSARDKSKSKSKSKHSNGRIKNAVDADPNVCSLHRFNIEKEYTRHKHN